MWKEFREFISRGNVMDMAVGIIIGAAFTGVVNSTVSDLVMPIVGVFTGGIDFSSLYINLSGTAYATLKEAEEAGAAVIKIGLFINALINFLIIAAVVFMLVKGVNRIKRMAEGEQPVEEPKSPPPPPREQVLLEEIRDILSRQRA